MYEHEHFPNAPISEALIDIRATFEEDDVLAKADHFAADVASRFPRKEDRIEITGEVLLDRASGKDSSSAKSRKTGYALFSDSREKAVQARIDGFTFSKMKPYESWENLRNEAIELWELYLKTLNPTRVMRLAVRYINRIELPLPIEIFPSLFSNRTRSCGRDPARLGRVFLARDHSKARHGHNRSCVIHHAGTR